MSFTENLDQFFDTTYGFAETGSYSADNITYTDCLYIKNYDDRYFAEFNRSIRNAELKITVKANSSYSIGHYFKINSTVYKIRKIENDETERIAVLTLTKES